MKILAIETSCDETAVSIVEGTGGLEKPSFRIWAHAVSSQIKLHAKWGGVVPNLAKREHERNLIPVLDQALSESGLKIQQSLPWPAKLQSDIETYLVREQELLSLFKDYIPTIKVPDIDAIAVTVGPGLEPALWVGINFARALSAAWQKPLIPTNHMEGHIVSPLLDQTIAVEFPALALLISGGHTEIVLLNDWLDYKVIGQTRDDAVGEAFDKVARMLGLPYPGGPEISKLAEIGTPGAIEFPRPMITSDDFDFSFSGLKTAVLYYLKQNPLKDQQHQADVARAFQDAAIEVLLKKTQKALGAYHAKTLIIGGGVIANTALRERFSNTLKDQVTLLIPEFKLSTDNATMIGMAAYLHTEKEEFEIATKLIAQGNLVLK